MKHESSAHICAVDNLCCTIKTAEWTHASRCIYLQIWAEMGRNIIKTCMQCFCVKCQSKSHVGFTKKESFPSQTENVLHTWSWSTNWPVEYHWFYSCSCHALYCIILYRFCHFWHTSLWPTSTGIPSPLPSDRTDARHLTIIILTLFNPVNENFPPFALILPHHCCTIVPKALYPQLQQWQGLHEVEKR